MKGSREPANLYEAVIALENWKNRQAEEPPAAPPALTREQQETLFAAIAKALRANERSGNNARNH